MSLFAPLGRLLLLAVTNAAHFLLSFTLVTDQVTLIFFPK
jgi:hypothetical protein